VVEVGQLVLNNLQVPLGKPAHFRAGGRIFSGQSKEIADLISPNAPIFAVDPIAGRNVTASYTYARTSEFEPSGRAEVPLTPRQSLGVLGMWEKEGVARVGVECYYTGRQRLEYNPYRDFSAPYVLVGAMAERKIAAHVKLFLNLENLANVRQTRWDPLLLPSRGADGRWTVDAWAPLDGRVINGGARFTF